MKVLYYAVNESPLHLYYLSKSLVTLRRTNRTIAPRVYIYASWRSPAEAPAASARLLRRIERSGAELVFRSPRRVAHATFLKWLPLPELDADTVLFADADTLYFNDPEKLFARYDRADFYARREMGTEPGREFRPSSVQARSFRASRIPVSSPWPDPTGQARCPSSIPVS